MRFFFLFLFSLLSIPFTHAINVSVDYNTFWNTEESYVEVSLYVSGRSLTPIVLPDSTVHSSIDVLFIFKDGDNIVQFDKFRLNSPIGKRLTNFVDLKRYGLNKGNYQLEVTVTDAKDEKNTMTTAFPISVQYNNTDFAISDIALLSSIKAPESNEHPFEKMGMILEPQPHAFYNRDYAVLPFYFEAYNTLLLKDESTFTFSYNIKEHGDETNNSILLVNKTKKINAITPILEHINIKELPSAEYVLTIEILSEKQGLLATQSTTFWRSNPHLDQEIAIKDVKIEGQFVEKLSDKQVEYSLRAITALIPEKDVEIINYMFREKNIKAQRMYLYSYWTKESPVQSEVAYSQFMAVAKAVDKQFRSGFRYGFESDRGRIFLKYGRPNTMERRDQEMSAPPYEVWFYSQLEETGQTNVNFIFYNPSLAGDDYQLLHSTARGERQNPNWERVLYDGVPNQIEGNNYFDGRGVQDGYNREARDIFEGF